MERKTSALHYVSAGSGPPVILLHGLAASHHDWDHLAPALARTGYQTFAPDLLGHGSSPQPLSPAGFTGESVYASLTGWLAQLDLAQPVVLVSHSLGGYLSLLLALRQPQQVRALVLIDPLLYPAQITPLLRLVAGWPALAARALPLTPLWAANLAARLPLTDSAGLSPGDRHHLGVGYKRTTRFMAYLLPTLLDLRPLVKQVTQPALVLWGERDLTLDPMSFPRLVQNLPQAASCSFPRCRHQPHRSAPGEIEQNILSFLSGVDLPVSSR